jgi:hypothetical protein
MNWQQIDQDDYKATEGDYLLRAEQMDIDNWWWCVYYKTEEIGGSLFSEITKTKDAALKAAEKCYREHLNKSQSLEE